MNVSVSVINTTTVIEITSTDNLADVDYISYRLNAGDWWVYTGPFTLYEGDYTLEFNATDLAGNEEWTNSIVFSVEDITPPTTTISPSNDTVLEDSYVYLWAEDDWTGSGVSMILYSINAGSWIVYEAGFTLPENGTYTISYFAMDQAGNNEFVDYKIYYVVEALAVEEETGGSGSGGSGGSSGSKKQSHIEAFTEEKDYLPSSTVIISGKLHSEGNYAEGKLVFIDWNEHTFNTTTTSDGSFNFRLTAPRAYGNYSMQVHFDGDSKWAASSCFCTFLVVEQDATLTIKVNGVLEENRSITINLSLTTDDGKDIPNEELEVRIFARNIVDAETSSLNDYRSVNAVTELWELIYETTVITNQQGKAQLLFIVPTSQDLKLEAVFNGCANEEEGYLGASEAVYVEGEPQVMDFGFTSISSDQLIIVGAVGVVGAIGVCAAVGWKAGVFFRIKNREVVAFTEGLLRLIRKKRKISIEELSKRIDLSNDVIEEYLNAAIRLRLIEGFIDQGTQEFVRISVFDEFELKQKLQTFAKHNKGVFSIVSLAKRFGMKVEQLLTWLQNLQQEGEIDPIKHKEDTLYKIVDISRNRGHR